MHDRFFGQYYQQNSILKARRASDLIQFQWLDTYDVFWKTLWMKRSLKQPFGTFIFKRKRKSCLVSQQVITTGWNKNPKEEEEEEEKNKKRHG